MKKTEQPNNGKAPNDIVDLYGWLEMMRATLGLLSEVMTNRDFIKCAISEDCFEDLVQACVKECTGHCSEGRRVIRASYPDDPSLREEENEAPDPKASAKMGEDQGQEAKA